MALGQKQFKNPPIKEAIFAISFKETIAQDQLLKFAETAYVKNNFPTHQPGFIVTVSNKQKPNAEPKDFISTTQEPEGFMVRSIGERNRLIKVKPSMLSYHNFNKYAGWDNMFEELKEIWKHFCDSAGKSVVSQISVRYLNHLSIPFPFKGGFDNYIKLLPQIPQGISNAVNSFFIQINVPNDEGDLTGIITETSLPYESDNFAKILIDLSVVKHGEFDCTKEDMWEDFIKIRNFKNKLFFNCITEETESLFN